MHFDRQIALGRQTAGRLNDVAITIAAHARRQAGDRGAQLSLVVGALGNHRNARPHGQHLAAVVGAQVGHD